MRLLIYLFIAYVGITALFYFFANFILYQPPIPSYDDTHQILKITTKDNAIISAIFLPNKNAKYTILVSHGNAEDLGTMMPFLHEFNNHGFAIFAYDYHGYGTSTGKPTEKNTYLDVDAAYDYLTEQLHIPPNQIILYGHSLGAALAIDLAARKPVAGLIIGSPFITAYRTITQIPVILFDKYNNLSKIKKIKCPVLVIHGKRDITIPFWHGEKLYNEANSPKYSLWVDKAGHNDVEIVGGNAYWQSIINFSKSISDPSSFSLPKPP